MPTTPYKSYEAAAESYLEKFRSLRDVQPNATKAVTRGAGQVSQEQMINEADAIADISAEMVELSASYLESPDAVVREGISGQLITQATAELQVAVELLQITEEKERRPVGTTRSVRAVQLQDVLTALEKSMATPPTQGLPIAITISRAVVKPSSLEEAVTQLQKSADITTAGIARRVQELGGDIAFNLVMQTEWAAVTGATGLLGKDITAKLEAVKKGAGALLARAVSVAAKTLYNVYRKISALLGKEVEEQARNKVNEWLEKVKEEGKIDIFESLVKKFYGLDSFKKALEDSLSRTTAEIDAIRRTTDEVTLLGEKFAVLTGRMESLANVVNLAKMLKFPAVLLVVASIQIGLLAAVLYSGSDYIGFREPRFPNLTKGVAELISEGVVPLL